MHSFCGRSSERRTKAKTLAMLTIGTPYESQRHGIATIFLSSGGLDLSQRGTLFSFPSPLPEVAPPTTQAGRMIGTWMMDGMTWMGWHGWDGIKWDGEREESALAALGEFLNFVQMYDHVRTPEIL